MLTFDNSKKYFDRAKKLFPGGVNSPVRAFKSVNGQPLFIKRGEGAYIWDEDDNKYLDFCASWGPLILGHNNKKVYDAVVETAANGMTFGTPTKLGVEIGELIINNHRYIDKLRFVSSGTEAVMSAIRLARGYTGKSKIVKFEGCYHGHVDSLMVKAGSGLATLGISTSAGIPKSFVEETIVLPLNDLEAFTNLLESQGDEIAAVIIEPIPANNGLLIQDNAFLAWLRKICDDQKVLLIFDEVISGFRVGFEGAAGYYAIQPDIITFGKIIGGGMPVGAFGGNEEIMSNVAPDGDVYQAGTLSANPVTMSAGIATLNQLLAPDFYANLEAKAAFIKKEMNFFFEEMDIPANLVQIGSIFWLSFSKDRILNAGQISSSSIEIFKKIHLSLLNNNIYLGPSSYEVGFVSAAHEQYDLEYFVESLKTACRMAYDI